jgi:hypothetical protein
LLIFACSKVNAPEETPQNKYSQLKQSVAAYFTDYGDAFRTTGHAYFGHAHDGTFDKAQFEKDVSVAFSEKHPVTRQTPAANALLIKSWNPRKETLVDYMHQTDVSENVQPYVLEAQNYVASAIDPSKTTYQEADLIQVVANIKSGMDKLEAKAEQDKSLNESEIVSVLIATTAAKSLTSAVSDVATDFFANLNLANSRNPAVLRGWFSGFVKAWFNVVATVVVAVATAVWTTVQTYGTILGSLGSGSSFDYYATLIGGAFGQTTGSIFDPFTGIYNCYFPEDAWKCPY